MTDLITVEGGPERFFRVSRPTAEGRHHQTLDLGAPAPGVVVVTLNRPDRYNAMTATMFDELERAAIANSPGGVQLSSPPCPSSPEPTTVS
jgi:hypothetical protein